jgi:hypothetical protein
VSAIVSPSPSVSPSVSVSEGANVRVTLGQSWCRREC